MAKKKAQVRPHHVSTYHGKSVVIDYVPDPKREFHIACMRIQDNVRAGEVGYVDTPDGKRYKITGGKKMAELVKADAS